MEKTIFIDYTKAEKIATGKMNGQCLITGCINTGESLVCEEHQRELGPEVLRQAKLKVLACKNHSERNVSFKNFNRLVKKAEKLQCDAGKVFADVKKTWPTVSEDMIRDIVNCLQ